MFYANTSTVFRNSPDKNSPINFILFCLFCFVFFKANTAIFVVLSCKNNLIVYNILIFKNTLICRPSARLSEWSFQGLCTCIVEREGMKVRWTRHRSFRFLCDKTKEISEVINFLGAFSLHRFSWLFLMHNISSKLVNFNSPTPTKGDKFSFV